MSYVIAGFEDALRKREHEFRIQHDEMSAKVLEYELKVLISVSKKQNKQKKQNQQMKVFHLPPKFLENKDFNPKFQAVLTISM